MINISSKLDEILKKLIGDSNNGFSAVLSSNLESRLLFNINLTKSFKLSKKEFIKIYLNDLLVLSFGNITRVAEFANLNRRHIHRLLNDLDISYSNYRKSIIKPSDHLKENIQEIIDATVDRLKNRISPKQVIDIYSNLDDFSELLKDIFEHPLNYENAILFFEKEYIEKALERNNFNIAKTAEEIEMSERTIYRKINKLGIGAV